MSTGHKGQDVAFEGTDESTENKKDGIGGAMAFGILDNFRFRVRNLTPTEYGRLQGFPMNTWRQVVSNSQAYKQFSNAVTVPLAEAIGKSIIEFLKEQEAEDDAKEDTKTGGALRGLREDILQIPQPG